MDGALPFGLRSAPKLFTAVADALVWNMGTRGLQRGMHYLDDFLIFRSPGTEECKGGLQLGLDVCHKLGLRPLGTPLCN